MEGFIRGSQREFVLGDLEELYAAHVAGGRLRALLGYLATGLASGARDTARRLWASALVDVRQALAGIARKPRFHIAAAAVLALGVGMITFSWGVEYGAYGRGLPVRAPERMVSVTSVSSRNGESSSAFSPRDAELIRNGGIALEEVGLWGTNRITLADRDHPPEQIYALHVTPEIFDLLEIRPVRGRALTAADGRRGATPVVLLGHRLWMRRYAGDESIIGRTVRVDGLVREVAGILPDGPSFMGEELWLPIPVSGPDYEKRVWSILARTTPGTNASAANARLAGLGARLQMRGEGAPRVHLRAVPFTASFRDPGSVGDRYLRVVRHSGWLLFLMALANVANLFLVRTRRRADELAVRRALGAGRARIMRHVLLEVAATVALGLVGGGLLAAGLLGRYRGGSESTVVVPLSWQQWTFGPPHLVVVARVGLIALLVVSVVVGVVSLRGGTSALLRSGRGITTRLRLARTLVALEVAGGGALFLLASLMIQSAWNLRTAAWGFATNEIMTGHVALPPGNDERTREDVLRVWSAIETGLAQIPGVASATVGTQLPLIRYAGRWGAWRRVDVDDPAPRPAEDSPHHYVAAVSPSYFATFEAPVLSGRSFTANDDERSEPVALVNASFAALYFPDGDALGHRVRVWNGDTPGAWRTVVGVAPHLWMDADENRDPQGIYIPLTQAAPSEVSLAIRVQGDPASYAEPIRRLVTTLLPGTPITDLRTMPQLIRDRTVLYRTNGPLFIWLGLAALILAVCGLYVVMAYLATIRAGEFGIRAAMGASRPRLVMRAILWGIPSLLVGVPLGVGAGLWLTRGFARFMFEVDPWSPPVATACFGLLIVTALAASLRPAIRAGKVDLLRVLKAE